MDEIKTKQQVVEKIKEASKILVTVSNSPSVDALSAALALTLLLDKQEKYATAIFSGETPPAIAFLEPEKTFDDTTDSLRDFIIALNKEKADHLRYKVVDDAVKIFITPYKTTIDESDLEFSQGDYNVELVVALGVNNQDHLDKALENHGQILHDAAIITMTAGEQTSTLGGIDWHDSDSSSLSEMVAGLAEALKVDKKKPLLDNPIATALLTGIVAETDRFSNERTTSKAMTIAATLMSAGADQQLIATELQASQEITTDTHESEGDDAEGSDTDSGVEVDTDSNDGSMTIKKDNDTTKLDINHEGETLADLDRRVLGESKAKKKVIEEVERAEEKAAQAEKEEEASNSASDPAPIVTAYAAEDAEVEPTFGGALNATADQAADDARREAENDQNRTILSHSYLGGEETPAAASSGAVDTPGFPGAPSTAPGSVAVNEVPSGDGQLHSAYAFGNDAASTDSAPEEKVAVGGGRVIQPLGEQAAPQAPAAPAYALENDTAAAQPPVEPTPAAPAYAPPVIEPLTAAELAPALAAAPASPEAPSIPPADFGLPLPPPLPDFSQMNGAPAPAIPIPPAPQPEILGDILAPEPQPQFQPEQMAPPAQPLEAPQSTPAPAADPTQFQIPGQQ